MIRNGLNYLTLKQIENQWLIFNNNIIFLNQLDMSKRYNNISSYPVVCKYVISKYQKPNKLHRFSKL